MDPRIPIPTDNVHKFLATFGLYLTMLCLALLVININYSNGVIGETVNAMYDLGDINTGTVAEISDKTTMQSYLKAKLDTAVSDRNMITYCLIFFFAIGLSMTVHGFALWHKKIQPQQDRIRELEEEKLSLEVAELKRQAALHSGPAPDSTE